MPKTFGIPQNRERVFTISIRKDIDDYSFEFPEPIELKLRLKDLMDEVVEEKYYLSDAQLKHIIENGNMNCHPSGKGQNGKVYVGNIAPTLTTGKGEGPKVLATDEDTMQCIQVGQMYGTEVEPNPQAGRIYDSRGISPTLDTCSGGNRMPKVIIGSMQRHCAISYNGIVPTLTSAMGTGGGHIPMLCMDYLEIRKLTPKECWRLQGFDDEDYEKAEKVNSNTQLYKQAGNSICVNVLEKIFINLLQLDGDKYNLKEKYNIQKKTLFSFDI